MPWIYPTKNGVRYINADPYKKIPKWCLCPSNKALVKLQQDADPIDWEKVALFNPKILE